MYSATVLGQEKTKKQKTDKNAVGQRGDLYIAVILKHCAVQSLFWFDPVFDFKTSRECISIFKTATADSLGRGSQCTGYKEVM